MKKNVSFTWDDVCQEAFDSRKQVINITSPNLSNANNKEVINIIHNGHIRIVRSPISSKQ